MLCSKETAPVVVQCWSSVRLEHTFVFGIALLWFQVVLPTRTVKMA